LSIYNVIDRGGASKLIEFPVNELV
jgi:hypothetical protein